MMGGLGTVNSGKLTDPVHELITAAHRATQCPANPDMIFPGCMLPQARVKCDHFVELYCFKIEFGGIIDRI